MNVIITLRGDGRRFQELGITVAKPMIEVKGKNLFEWSILSPDAFLQSPFLLYHQKRA